MLQKHQSLLIYSFVILFLHAVLFGCNSKPKLVPVSGKISIDNKPLKSGRINFNVKGYRMAQGIINSDGTYQLTTHALNDGCVLGEHNVTIQSVEYVNDETVRHFIPKRYENPKDSGLSAKVDKPTTEMNFELTWKGDSHKGPYNSVD